MFNAVGMGFGRRGGQPDLTQGLVAHYLLNNNADDSYGTYDGTSSGDVDFQGDKVSTDGISNYSTFPISSLLIYPFTVSIYIFPDSINHSTIYMVNSNSDTTLYAVGYEQTTNTIRMVWYSGTGNYTVLVDSQPLVDFTKPYHVVAVYEQNNFKLYIDGILIGTNVGTYAQLTGINEVSIGRLDRFTSTTYTKSVFSNFRFYNEVKDQSFIDALYAEGYYPKSLPLPTTDGLVAHYPLTGTAEDTTGNYDGTENGGLTYVDDAEFGSVPDFLGTSSSKITTTSALTVNDCTWNCWVRIDITESRVRAFISQYGLSTDGRIILGMNDNSVGEGSLFAVLNGLVKTVGTTTVVPNIWYMVTFTKSGTVSKLYVNGVIEATGTINLTLENSPMVIGGVDSINEFGHNGKLREARIYNKALIQQEITDIYNYEKNFRPIDIDDGLVAFYPLANNSLDNYKNQYDGTDTDMTYDGLSGVFNGSTSGIINTSAGSSITTGDITYCIWAKADIAPTSPKMLIGQSGATEKNRGILFNSLTVTVFSRDSAASYKQVSKTLTAIEQTEWHHYVIIQRGTILELYMDGIFIDSLDMISTYTFTNTLAIGTNPFDQLDFQFDGMESNGRFYNKAISTEQVAVIYNTEKGDFE